MKLNNDESLSKYAFNFNLSPYKMRLDVAEILARGTEHHNENPGQTTADFVAAHVVRVTVRPRLWGRAWLILLATS